MYLKNECDTDFWVNKTLKEIVEIYQGDTYTLKPAATCVHNTTFKTKWWATQASPKPMVVLGATQEHIWYMF